MALIKKKTNPTPSGERTSFYLLLLFGESILLSCLFVRWAVSLFFSPTNYKKLRESIPRFPKQKPPLGAHKIKNMK
jgi:hypothetical protein